MYSITRRTLHTWCGVAVLLITLAGCDNSALNGPVESAALGPASPSTVGRTADRASSLTSTLEVTEAGFDAVTNSTYPNLSASLSGQVDVTAKGYGTVSFAVHPSIVDSALAVMFPTDFAFTPDAIHFDHRGQAQALALESFMQTVLMDATDQYLALEARAGASGSKKLALGAEGMRGEPPFRDLPLAARLQRLREYGFTVEPLGQGRFRLVRTGSGFPDSFPPGNGSRSGSATQQRSAGEEMRVETIYDSKTGNMSQTKFYVGNDLVSENELTAGGAEAQTTVYSGSAGEGRRVVRFSTPLPTWK